MAERVLPRDAFSRQGLLPRSYYMSTSTDTAHARAEAQFKKKEQQVRDGEQARAEYDAQQQAIREKTARLRALRWRATPLGRRYYPRRIRRDKQTCAAKKSPAWKQGLSRRKPTGT